MPFGSLQPIQLLPGIYKETSDLAGGQRWVDGNRVRFFKGQPQPIEGWQEIDNSNSIVGAPRGAIDWVTLDRAKLIGLGTYKRLYIWQGGLFYNITPQRDTGTLGTDPFTTTDTSSLVSVSDTTHGVIVGDIVTFSGASTFNGVTMTGDFVVTSVTNANTYVVQANETATASGSGGGASVDYIYEINIGGDSGSVGLGWGAGGWGEGTWSTPRESSNLIIAPRTWALTNWGEDLLANPRGGAIYYFDYSGGLSSPAVALSSGSDAPTKADFLLVTSTSRHVVAFACTPLGSSTQDKLHIRWSTAGAFNTTDAWESLETNTAGDVQLELGYEIISALESSQSQILVWTDSALYSMNYVGPDLVFDTRLEGRSCGIRGPHARASFGGVTYFMGCEDFYFYDGRVSVLPCDVRDYVFNDLNEDQRDKVYCGLNRKWQEVWWFYCSSGSDDVDRYVAYDISARTWHIGELDRTSWLDRSETLQHPVAFDASGNMYQHELDGMYPTDTWIESGDFQLENGDQLMFTDRFIPDFQNIGGTVDLYFRTRKYPMSTQVSKGPFSITSSTEKVDFRHRGRQASIRLESDEINWRLASFRVRIKPDGIR